MALEGLKIALNAAAKLETRQQSVEKFGIDPADGVEIPAPEGALVIFCPFCLHSSSPNVHGDVSRYVVVQSFQHHTAAELLRNNLVRKRYLKAFHEDTHDALVRLVPRPLHQLLRGQHLWGEAMSKDLCAFKERGFFLSSEPLIPTETMATIERLQREVEPEWRATECPPGLNILACQFLMVLCRGGDQLLKLLEQPQTLTLAAALLELDTVKSGVGAGAGVDGLVIEAVGCGDTLRLEDYPNIQGSVPREKEEEEEEQEESEDAPGKLGAQLEWHSDGEFGLQHVSFRTAIDPQQGPGTPNAGLRVLLVFCQCFASVLPVFCHTCAHAPR